MEMMNKLKKVGACLGMALLMPCLAGAQMLEVVPESNNTAVTAAKPSQRGTTMTGSTGLLTIATPDFQDERQYGFSFKYSNSESNLNINNTKVDVEKDEYLVAIRYHAKPNLELSLSDLSYDRSSSPTLNGIDVKKDHFALGMKYSTNQDEKAICFGFNFSPMTAEDLNLADIEQIENLRNVYCTMAEEITPDLNGYLNLSYAFTKKQKIDFGNGVVKQVNRKDILVGAVGLEYKFTEYASVFSEAKFGNYRDFDYFRTDSVRHRIHAGARYNFENSQLEISALNITEDNPTIIIGGSIGY